MRKYELTGIGSMTEIVDKWEHPSIMDVDNEGFVAVREHLYQMLHELLQGSPRIIRGGGIGAVKTIPIECSDLYR